MKKANKKHGVIKPEFLKDNMSRHIKILWAVNLVLAGMGIGMIIIAVPFLIIDIFKSMPDNAQINATRTDPQDAYLFMKAVISVGLAGGLFFHGLPFTSRHETIINIETKDQNKRFLNALKNDL